MLAGAWSACGNPKRRSYMKILRPLMHIPGFRFAFLALSVTGLTTVTAVAQGTQVQFGKNRVQYTHHLEEWLQYESENFITYWYGEGRPLGQAAVMIAETEYSSIQRILEHRMNEKIEIIVFSDITDLKQSNIGSEEIFVNTGWQTKIVGNKIFVYFDGDHSHFRNQIREGIAGVYVNDLLFGSNLQEIVQNAVMLSLPEWFKQGLIAYVGQEWNTDLDNQLRDIILSRQYKDFNRFALENPELAGHSLWYFIAQNFGKANISNLLYLTRINHNLDAGFLYVLGSPYQPTLKSWEAFYRQRYESETAAMDRLAEVPTLRIRNKRKLPVTQIKLSPDARYLAYVTNDIGRFRIFIQESATGKRSLVGKGSFRNPFQATDYNYPLVAWSLDGKNLTALYEKRDIVRMLRYDHTTGKKSKENFSPDFQRIYSLDYINEDDLLLSAAVRGNADLYIHHLSRGNSDRITDDFHDDLDAVLTTVENKPGILWASNRPDSLLVSEKLDSILPSYQFDIFYLKLNDPTAVPIRVTRTPDADERQPIAIDTTWFGYLSDESGIHNRHTAYLKDVIVAYQQHIYLKNTTVMILPADSVWTAVDSSMIDSIVVRPLWEKRAFSHPQTQYDRSLRWHHCAPAAGKIASVWNNQGKPEISLLDMDAASEKETVYTVYRSFLRNAAMKLSKAAPPVMDQQKPKIVSDQPIDATLLPEEKRDSARTNYGYFFQSDFDDPPAAPVQVLPSRPAVPAEPATNSVTAQLSATPDIPGLSVHRFRQTRIIPSRTKFRTNFVSTQLDNSLLFGGLDNFAATPEALQLPPLGILLKGNFRDLMEDHEFEGGVRIPTTFNGTEYFLVYRNKKKRIDRSYAVYRRALRYTDVSEIFATRTRSILTLGQTEWRYPLDIFSSFRGTATLRMDQLVQLATDSVTLRVPTQQEQRFGLRLEYVFDNTLDVGINIKNGTRYKIYAEVVKRFNLQLLNDLAFDFGKGYMGLVGFDARHYQRLGRRSVLALRSAGAASFGSENILYYLGGVDNWLFPQFSEKVPIPDENFAYQTLATNLRGFPLNARNGSNYFVCNAELRVPVFQYFSRRPIQSAFFRNFQLVGFFDIGTAWSGVTPFSEENPLNTSTEINPPTVVVQVRYFRDPIVAGYGLGVRTLIFGYFVRVDYAWGVETRRVSDPRWYLSFGMDF